MSDSRWNSYHEYRRILSMSAIARRQEYSTYLSDFRFGTALLSNVPLRKRISAVQSVLRGIIHRMNHTAREESDSAVISNRLRCFRSEILHLRATFIRSEKTVTETYLQIMDEDITDLEGREKFRLEHWGSSGYSSYTEKGQQRTLPLSGIIADEETRYAM